MNLFDGKKTHITVVLFILCTFAENLLGFDIPGFTPSDDWLQQVFVAIGASTGRDALQKLINAFRQKGT